MNLTEDKFLKEAVDLVNNNKITVYCNLPTEILISNDDIKVLRKTIEAASAKVYSSATQYLAFGMEN